MKRWNPAVGWQPFFVYFQLDFDDVLAEPSAAQGFEWVWKLAFVVFSQTKAWFYKIFAALIAVPASLMWALIFALVTVVYIWILSPALRLFDLSLAVLRRVVVGLMSVTVQPAATAVSHVFGKFAKPAERQDVEA